jgi:hypothetical protein
VRLAVEQRPRAKLLWHERRWHRRDRQLRFQHRGKRYTLQPDSGYLVALNGHRLLLLGEVDRGTASLPVSRDKLNHYDLWLRSAEGERYLHELARQYDWSRPPQPRLLVIAQGSRDTGGDEPRCRNLFRLTLDFPRSLRKLLWLTTATDLTREVTGSGPGQAAIWLRAKDTSGWLKDYRQVQEHLPRAPEHRRHNHRRLDEFLAPRLKAQRRHTLFPKSGAS